MQLKKKVFSLDKKAEIGSLEGEGTNVSKTWITVILMIIIFFILFSIIWKVLKVAK